MTDADRESLKALRQMLCYIDAGPMLGSTFDAGMKALDRVLAETRRDPIPLAKELRLLLGMYDRGELIGPIFEAMVRDLVLHDTVIVPQRTTVTLQSGSTPHVHTACIRMAGADGGPCACLDGCGSCDSCGQWLGENDNEPKPYPRDASTCQWCGLPIVEGRICNVREGNACRANVPMAGDLPKDWP